MENLFDLAPTHRTKLEVWREKNSVTTRVVPEDTEYLSATPEYWEAIWQHPDSTWRMGTGQTEELACFDLANRIHLPFLESITADDCRIAKGGV